LTLRQSILIAAGKEIVITALKLFIMKLFLIAAAITGVLTSCGNSSNTADASSDTSVTQYRGVENVNGNIPDTAATGAEPNTNYHQDSAK
jgi:hypothetical protein